MPDHTYWFPAARRSRVNALFMIGIPVAGVRGGPFSGWILSAFDSKGGWASWQWRFFIEALPSFVLGVITLFYLPNRIRTAKWLSNEERAVLEENIERDQQRACEAPAMRKQRICPLLFLGCGFRVAALAS